MNHVYDRNTAGRDFIVGDIHGCFSRLQAHLDYIGVNPAVDRLFSVGDLVDRGPESEEARDWLAKPWFHAVRGNHEQMAIDHVKGFSDTRMYIGNGGGWFVGLTREEQCLIADEFSALPIAITLHTAAGRIGIVHAECPIDSWDQFLVELAGPRAVSFENCAMWSRERITNGSAGMVNDVEAVVVGHTPMRNWTSLGNTIFIDTGAVFREHEFTILDVATMRPVPLKARAVDWAS